MADYEKRLDMSRAAQEAGVAAARESYLRTAASRFYYAAYHAVTAVLLYKGVTLPVVDGKECEAWSHADSPDIFSTQLEPYIRDRNRRADIVRRLRELYALRVNADYSAADAVTENAVDAARRDCGYIVKVVRQVIE